MSLFDHQINPETGERKSELSLGQPARSLSETEMMQLWSRVYGEGKLASHEMRRYRVIVAWRLTRALAHQQGRLTANERLSDLFKTEDSWFVPMAALTPTVSTDATPAPDRWSMRQLLSQDGGLALVPMTEGRAHRERFSAMVSKLAESMWIERGSTEIPRLGEYGLYGLTHPDTIEKFWPTRFELVAWEEELLGVLQDKIYEMQRPRVLNYMVDTFGLSMLEARGLFHMATDLIRETYALDLETEQAIAAARQDKIYCDAMEAGQLTVARSVTNDGMRARGPAEQVGVYDYYIEAMTKIQAANAAQNVIKIDVPKENTDGN